MVEKVNHPLSHPSSHAPNIQKGHGMIIGSEATNKQAERILASLNEKIEDWNTNPTSINQPGRPIRYKVAPLASKSMSPTDKKSSSRGIQAIEQFSKHVKGQSPSLEGRTHSKKPPAKKRRRT